MTLDTNLTPQDLDERLLRQNIDARIRAVRERNAEALLALYAPQLISFDMVAPLQNRGLDAVRKRVEQWFGSFVGPIDYELREIEIEVSGQVAFDHHLTHVKGQNKEGVDVNMWFRETVGYRKLDGVWRVTHQHSSVPFDMSTGLAQLGLSPRPTAS